MKNKRMAGVLAVLVLAIIGICVFWVLPQLKGQNELASTEKEIDAIRVYWGERDVDLYGESDIQKMEKAYLKLVELKPDQPENMLELVKLACYRKDWDTAQKRAEDMKTRWPDASETQDAPGFITMYKDYLSDAKIKERAEARAARQQRAQDRQRNQQQGGGQGNGGQGGNNRGQGGAAGGQQGNNAGQSGSGSQGGRPGGAGGNTTTGGGNSSSGN